MKRVFAKTRHNPSIITDFEWNIPKYKNKYHNVLCMCVCVCVCVCVC